MLKRTSTLSLSQMTCLKQDNCVHVRISLKCSRQQIIQLNFQFRITLEAWRVRCPGYTYSLSISRVAFRHHGFSLSSSPWDSKVQCSLRARGLLGINLPSIPVCWLLSSLLQDSISVSERKPVRCHCPPVVECALGSPQLPKETPLMF